MTNRLPNVSELMQRLTIHTASVYNGSMNNARETVLRERVNLTFPKTTLRLLDRVSKRGSRSAFVDRAVRFYVSEIGHQNLRKQLQQGATKRAGRDLGLAEEWFSIDEGVWQKGKTR